MERRLLVVLSLVTTLVGQIVVSKEPLVGVLLLGIALAAVLIEGWLHPRPLRSVGFGVVIAAVLGAALWREPRGWFFLAMAVVLAGTSLRYTPTPAQRQAGAAADFGRTRSAFGLATAATVPDSAAMMELDGSLPEPNYWRAVLFGFGAAMLGAAAWYAVTLATHTRWGLIAWGVGHLVGRAVRRGAGGVGNRALQIISAVLGGYGIIIGYFLDVRHALLQVFADKGIVGVSELRVFFTVIRMVIARPQIIGVFGLVFIVIGVLDAWRGARGPVAAPVRVPSA